MTLLHWSNLEPAGLSNLAAIRFSSPVRVHSIRIFPTDVQPFVQHLEITSRTEPRSFFLDLYFNAHPIRHPTKGKAKATNTLVPTAIAYAGGQMDFNVNMGAEHATRLLIVKGSFECVSLAIYGEVLSETSPLLTPYEPKALISVEPTSLSRVLDPSSSRNPTDLARQLLNLIDDAPPLTLIIRLMFCLKPLNDDWDLPEFPYLHPNLEHDATDFDLEKAFKLTTRPVADDCSLEVLVRFAENVSHLIDEDDASHPYLIAGILSNAASQCPDMAISLLEALDFTKIFDALNLDEATLLRLLHAATNVDVARYLHNEWFLNILGSIQQNVGVDQETQSAARRLESRIRGWAVLEDVLTNTQGDFTSAVTNLKQIGTEEQSVGIWLESMLMHRDIVAKLEENPILPIPLSHPPQLFRSPGTASHDEFVAFMRAYIGVACVIAVYAWSDSLPDKHCRERTLGILRLWQSVDGYREIVDHLLLLRQMTFRLECMMDNNDVPTRAGIDAEHILVNLAQNPQALLSSHMIKCILSLKQPLSFISEEERLSMRNAAIVADDGLYGAVDELLRTLERPATLDTLRTLRVACAVIEEELQDQGDPRVMEEFWKEGSRGAMTCLVDVFVRLSTDIRNYFSVKPPTISPQEVKHQLFRAANDILKLILRLLPVYPLPGREIRMLVTSAANVFVCTDAADMTYSQTSPTCIAAQETRQSCIDIVRVLSEPGASTEGSYLNAEAVLKTLLEHGLFSDDCDPACHLLQVFCLIDYLLPLPDSNNSDDYIWNQYVLPNMLGELWAFCRVLDTENKVHFIKRLVKLDRGLVGIGEWLLLEELKGVLNSLRSLEDPSLNHSHRLAMLSRIRLSLRFLDELLEPESSVSAWGLQCIAATPDIASILHTCLLLCLDHRLNSSHLTALVQSLASRASTYESSLRFVLALQLLWAAQTPETPNSLHLLLEIASSILSTIPLLSIQADRVADVVGTLLSSLAAVPQALEKDISACVLSLLQWLYSTSKSGLPQLASLRGITLDSFTTLCKRLHVALTAEQIALLDSLTNGLSIANDSSSSEPLVSLPEKLELSLQDIEELLHSSLPIPSTPPRRALNQDVLGLVTISPPTALIRSPASTGLTKTYSKNDFRQLRQTPAARQNTSRLPSMHVDEFESSPTLLALPMPGTPIAGPSTTGIAYAADGYSLSAFSPI